MSLANDSPRSPQERGDLTTISMLDSLMLASAISVGIWALIVVTILGV